MGKKSYTKKTFYVRLVTPGNRSPWTEGWVAYTPTEAKILVRKVHGPNVLVLGIKEKGK